LEISGAYEPIVADPQPETKSVEPVQGRSWWDLAAGFFATLGGVGALAHWPR
jgi:hypothetical protein